MKKSNLAFVQAQLKIISGYQKNDVEKINNLLNDKTKLELDELKAFHFEDEGSLSRYLKRSPQKDFNDYCVAPVNLLRYRIFQELEKGNKIEIKSYFDKFEQKLLSKNISTTDLPHEIQELFSRNGWGISSDPYHSWRDLRKVVYDYLITPTNYERLINELNKIAEDFKRTLQFDKCALNIKGPWGSQNNSLDDYCWIAWCPGDSMKKTVHLGLRVHPSHFIGSLYVGDEFYKNNNFQNQVLREEEFSNLQDALSWLYSLRKVCINLNQDRQAVVNELQNINQENLEQINDNFSLKRTGSRDSLGLHIGTQRTREFISAEIEDCHLYLFKVEGLIFRSEKFAGSGVFKIGMSATPSRRKKDILKGFGLSSLLSIREIFVLKNKAKYETHLKDFIDGSPDFYYDGEYFCTSLSDEEVKRVLERELNKIDMTAAA